MPADLAPLCPMCRKHPLQSAAERSIRLCEQCQCDEINGAAERKDWE